MAEFRVWDEFNANEDEAKTVLAASAYGAAIQFAERDIDGLHDGLYQDSGRELHSLERQGQPISVRDSDGALHRFKVGIVEFEPRFDAVKLSPEEGPT